MPVTDAVRAILSARLDDIATFKECKRKHDALREWINAE